MIGYGKLLLDAAEQSGCNVVEFRAASFFGRLLPNRFQGLTRKLANNVDRFMVTPLMFVCKNADIVHVVDPGNAIYLPLIRHRCSIVTVHDMIPYLARDGKLQGWQPTRTGLWLMRKITAQLSTVDHIVCVSRATKRDLLSYVDIPEERVSVIHNAVFQPMEPAIRDACTDLRARLDLPVTAPLILHVGRNWYKNRETVLEVAAKVCNNLSEVNLVLVGALTPALEKQAEMLELGDKLHVLDRVAQEDMGALYTTAAVLLFPSHYEGFGLPVLEAQMCGTPVVCSDRGSLPEVIQELSNMYLPNDIAGLALKTAVECKANRKPRGSAISELPSNFSNSTWNSRHHSLYKNAINEIPSKGAII
jgi:glycosyltransferase involved in cell wall biosynthesis